jgi:hypothetical protein
MATEMSKRRDGIPPEALGRGAAAPEPARQSEMAQRRPRVARGEPRELPGYGEVWIQILGAEAMEEIEIATFKSMERAGIPYSPMHVGTWNLHRFRRVLAQAVRHSERHDEPFGSLADWGQEPEDAITNAITLYQDVRFKLDPASSPYLTDQQSADLMDAFKKKDFNTLKSYGAATLASWLVTGELRQSSSRPAASSSGDSLPESSGRS